MKAIRESGPEYVAETKKASKVLYKESPLLIPPTLAAIIGLNNAIFIQQLEFWLSTSQHFYDGKRWVYNTVAQWNQQFPFWSENTIKRIVAELRLNGVVVTTDKYNDDNRDRTLWYTIDYTKLDEFMPSPLDTMAVPIGDSSNQGVSNGAWQGIQRSRSNKTESTTQETTDVSFSGEKEDLALAQKNPKKATVYTQKPVEQPKRKRKPKQLALDLEGFTPNDGQKRREDGAIIPSQPEMYRLVCKICGIDWDVIRGTSQEKNVGKVASNLRKAEYSEEELRRWWVEVWKNDYRSKNDGKPTPNLLLQLVGKLVVRPLVEEE